MPVNARDIGIFFGVLFIAVYACNEATTTHHNTPKTNVVVNEADDDSEDLVKPKGKKGLTQKPKSKEPKKEKVTSKKEETHTKKV